MPTAEKTIEFDGTQALVTNVSSHTPLDDRSFRVFKDLVSDYARRIVKRDGKGSSLGSVAGTEIQTIHEFIWVDPSGSAANEIYVLGAINGGVYIYLWNGVTTWTGQSLPITPTAGGRWFFWNAENRVFACNGKDALLYGLRTGVGTLTWRTVGVDAPSSAPTYSLTATNPPITNTSTSQTVTTVQGDATVTASGAAFTTGGSWVGKRMTINGVHYEILSVTSTTVLELTEGFKETGAAGLSWSVYPGVGDWDDIAPKYQFSYYNPTTGHASNPSPVLQVTEQDQRGRTIVVTIAGAAENTTAYNNGFTQIQMFRTAKNATIPVALNEKLNNNNTASNIVYTETSTKFLDTFLTDIEAPTKNRKPVSGIACGAFHQGRNWLMHSASQRLYFSPIAAEIDFGVAVECFPALYTRSIADMRGLLVVGGASSADSMVVQTGRGDFSVDGYDSITFSPYKLRTRESGSYLGAAASVDGDLVQFYGDKRMLAAGADIARDIQDRLTLVRDSLLSKVRVYWHSANSENYLFLSVPSSGSSTANDYTYVFDLDRGGAIYEWNAGFSAFATVHNPASGALELLAGDSAGAVYKLLAGNTQDAGADFTPTLKTGLIRFPEEVAEIKYVKLYVNDAQITSTPATAWTGRIFLNEQTDTGATDGTVIPLTFRVSDYREQSAQGRELIATFTTSLRTTAKVFQLEITFPTVDDALLIEKGVIGFSGSQTAEAQS